MAQASSYPTKSPVVSGDKVLLLDSAASNAIKQASVADVAQQAANGVSVPRSSGTALFALDAGLLGASLVIASGATAYPFGNANNFSGLVILQELNTSGNVAMFLCGGGGVGVVMVSTTDSAWFAASDTAGKICLFYSSGAIAIKNNIGSSRTVNVTAQRIRTSQ